MFQVMKLTIYLYILTLTTCNSFTFWKFNLLSRSLMFDWLEWWWKLLVYDEVWIGYRLVTLIDNSLLVSNELWPVHAGTCKCLLSFNFQSVNFRDCTSLTSSLHPSCRSNANGVCAFIILKFPYSFFSTSVVVLAVLLLQFSDQTRL